MVFFDTDFKSHLCWQGIKIIIIFFTLNGNIFLQDHLIWLLIWSLSINVMIKLSCAVCTIHYPLGKAENYCSVLHLPHKLIWQLSTFSAVFNSKHSLISEIWPQAINCDLILSCFQITALSEIWPQAINSRQHAASLMSDVIPVDEIWLCCQICANFKFWNPGLKNVVLEFIHR